MKEEAAEKLTVEQLPQLRLLIGTERKPVAISDSALLRPLKKAVLLASVPAFLAY